MKTNDYLPYIQISDIPESGQPIADMIGIENYLKLCQYCMGGKMYFPMTDTVLKKVRNRMINQEYNGYNIMNLARKHRISTEQIKNVLKGSNSQKDH